MTFAMAAMLLVMLALPASAHHSFSAEFDSTKAVTLDGEVVMMEWVNPHSWLHIDVKKPDGTVERWKIEGGSPSVLMRLGWNRNSLPVGTRITVVGFQAKDGSLRASSRCRGMICRRISSCFSSSLCFSVSVQKRPLLRSSRSLRNTVR